MVKTTKQQILRTAQAAVKQQEELQPVALSPSLPAASPSETSTPLQTVPLSDQEDLESLKKRQEISQQDKRFEAEMEQRRIDRELKQSIATLVFRFLAVETLGVFIVVIIQGARLGGFHLDDSTINIFLGATLLQISSMAVIITRHLYPTSQD
jgi:Trp operon repressor